MLYPKLGVSTFGEVRPKLLLLLMALPCFAFAQDFLKGDTRVQDSALTIILI